MKVEFVGKNLCEPAQRKNYGKTKEFVEVLKERPGVWAIYAERSAPWTSHYSYRKHYSGTEWATRKRGNKWVVFARYVGRTINLEDCF